MTNNSMEDVASKFGNNWGRLAAVIVTLAQPCEIPQGRASNGKKKQQFLHSRLIFYIKTLRF